MKVSVVSILFQRGTSELLMKETSGILYIDE